MSVRKSETGKTVYFEIGIWYDDNSGKIHVSAPSVSDFGITTVRYNPKRKRGHPHLFQKLAQCLRESGVSVPEKPGG